VKLTKIREKTNKSTDSYYKFIYFFTWYSWEFPFRFTL